MADSDSITLTAAEAKAVRLAWSEIRDICTRLHCAGASARLRPDGLLHEAQRLARSHLGSLTRSRVVVMSAALRGISEQATDLASLAQMASWYLPSVALGAAIRAESERLDVTAPKLTGRIESAVKAYEAARCRWRAGDA